MLSADGAQRGCATATELAQFVAAAYPAQVSSDPGRRTRCLVERAAVGPAQALQELPSWGEGGRPPPARPGLAADRAGRA